jgi:hypothetical protein
MQLDKENQDAALKKSTDKSLTKGAANPNQAAKNSVKQRGNSDQNDGNDCASSSSTPEINRRRRENIEKHAENFRKLGLDTAKKEMKKKNEQKKRKPANNVYQKKTQKHRKAKDNPRYDENYDSETYQGGTCEYIVLFVILFCPL